MDDDGKAGPSPFSLDKKILENSVTMSSAEGEPLLKVGGGSTSVVAITDKMDSKEKTLHEVKENLVSVRGDHGSPTKVENIQTSLSGLLEGHGANQNLVPNASPMQDHVQDLHSEHSVAIFSGEAKRVDTLSFIEGEHLPRNDVPTVSGQESTSGAKIVHKTVVTEASPDAAMKVKENVKSFDINSKLNVFQDTEVMHNEAKENLSFSDCVCDKAAYQSQNSKIQSLNVTMEQSFNHAQEDTQPSINSGGKFFQSKENEDQTYKSAAGQDAEHTIARNDNMIKSNNIVDSAFQNSPVDSIISSNTVIEGSNVVENPNSTVPFCKKGLSMDNGPIHYSEQKISALKCEALHDKMMQSVGENSEANKKSINNLNASNKVEEDNVISPNIKTTIVDHLLIKPIGCTDPSIDLLQANHKVSGEQLDKQIENTDSFTVDDRELGSSIDQNREGDGSIQQESEQDTINFKIAQSGVNASWGDKEVKENLTPVPYESGSIGGQLFSAEPSTDEHNGPSNRDAGHSSGTNDRGEALVGRRVRKSATNDRGEALVGRRVRKKFGKKLYMGDVVSFDNENSWYKVRYEDGDEEELELNELEPLLMSKSNKKKEIKKKQKDSKDLGPQTRVFKKVGKSRSSKMLRKRVCDISHKPDSANNSQKKKQFNQRLSIKENPSKTDSKEDLSQMDSETSKPLKQSILNSSTIESKKRKKDSETTLENVKTLKSASGTKVRRLSRYKMHGATGNKTSTSPSLCSNDKSNSKQLTKKDSVTDFHDTNYLGSIEKPQKNVHEPGGIALIGKKTKKYFGGQLYSGKVIDYDCKAKYYKVKYDDGDEEELEWSELEPTLVSTGQKPLSFKNMLRARTLAARKIMKSVSSSEMNDPSSIEEIHKLDSVSTNTTEQYQYSSVYEEAKDGSCTRDGAQDHLISGAHINGEVYLSPRPLAAARYASASDAEVYEYYAWGEVAGYDKTKCPVLSAAKLLPTSLPIVHLAASQHHLAAITAAGQVWLWRNRHDNIFSRCNEWEHIACLEEKKLVLIDVAGPDLDRVASGYQVDQEDQVPDPFYLVAIGANGQDYILQGSQCQEPVRTYQLSDELHYPPLKNLLLRSSSNVTAEKIVQVSVGTVEAPDESPFIGYITDTGHLYIRSATKDYMDEANLVTGFTGKPIKIQCGRAFHTIIMTDDGRAWTWGQGYYPGIKASGFPISTCQPAVGTLVGRKVIDVGCYGEDFIALTNDGDVHQWTHAVPNPAAGVYNVPATPLYGHGPCIPHGHKLNQIAIGAGMCAGITESGTVHTWKTDMKGGFSSPSVPDTQAPSPLGREGNQKDTSISSLGHKCAVKAMCVAGSLIVVVRKKSRGRISSKKRLKRSKADS